MLCSQFGPYRYQAVCRDVWTLHLSLFPSPIPAEPLSWYQDQGQETEPPAPEDLPQNDDGDSDDASSSSTDEESERDPEMEALLREMSEPSSSEHEDQPPPTSFPVRKAKKRRERGTYDLPANNIAVLVLGCWTLRIPVLYMDFIRFVFHCMVAYIYTYCKTQGY
jgi:RNA polymerase I-specific transcription initiation factor RRN7